jgi:hypothetical protein
LLEDFGCLYAFGCPGHEKLRMVLCVVAYVV